MSAAVTTAFSDFLTTTVLVPMGVLLSFAALIVLPTGELITFVAGWLRKTTPGEYPDRERERRR